MSRRNSEEVPSTMKQSIAIGRYVSHDSNIRTYEGSTKSYQRNHSAKEALNLYHDGKPCQDFNNLSQKRFSGNILSSEQLEKLIAKHGCRHFGQSFLEPYLQPFWKTIAEFVPNSWSPNAITLIGLIINGLTTLILLTYSQDAREEAPKLTYYFCALGLFIYQVLDSIDERQIRCRINGESLLKEIFNHGCDAVSNAFVIIGLCTAMKLGSHPRLMYVQTIGVLFVYYASHWQTYCTGIINYQTFDVMEARFSIILLFLLTGLFGTNVWDFEPIEGYPLKLLPVALILLVGFCFVYGHLNVILVQGGVGKNGSTIADTSVISPLAPMCALFVIGVFIFSNSTSFVLQRHPTLFVATYAVVAVKLSIKMVISHMSRSEMKLFDESLAYLLGHVLIGQYLNWLSDYICLCLCFITCTANLLLYCAHVCYDICSYLDIQCFKVIRSNNNNDDVIRPGSHDNKKSGDGGGNSNDNDDESSDGEGYFDASHRHHPLRPKHSPPVKENKKKKTNIASIDEEKDDGGGGGDGDSRVRTIGTKFASKVL